MGLFTRSTKPAEDLVENGIRGRATVQKADIAGLNYSYSGPVREKTVEAILSGEKSVTKMKLDLRVEIPGREPYSAQITVPIPTGKIRYMTGGSVIPVLVDPKDNNRMNVDWDGEFQQGTIDQMAAADPRIAAALKGAGVDVAKVAQMQRDAIALGQTPGNVIIGGQLAGASAFAPRPDPIDQLERLAKLRDAGALTEEEFTIEKAKILEG